MKTFFDLAASVFALCLVGSVILFADSFSNLLGSDLYFNQVIYAKLSALSAAMLAVSFFGSRVAIKHGRDFA